MVSNTFLTSGVSITDAYPLNHPGLRNRTLVGHMITDPGRKNVHENSLSSYFCLRKPDIKSEEVMNKYFKMLYTS